MPLTNGHTQLTGTERRLLLLIARLDGAPCSKARMAECVGRCAHTVDRAIRRLREMGAIESTPAYAENGGQAANSYRVASADALAEALRHPSD